MCGICGIVNFNGNPVSEESLWSMTRRLDHRGPDDRGVQLFPGAGFGHTRLSIIDLSQAGHQPMPNEDASIWITYNGELYNFRELRRELEHLYSFCSQSDTEVILHAYEEWGEDCVKRFNGIFAFAIYDSRNKKVFAARDQVGVKPFYYAADGHRFAFASEVKALLALDIVPRVAKENVAEYLMYGWLADSRTLFEGVKSLEPGHRLSFSLGEPPQVVPSCYYRPADRVRADEYRRWEAKSPEEAIERCAELLETSVRDQMVSDVPVGSLCSGGVDSSLVTALALKQSSQVKIYNVSLSDNAEMSEERYARAVATHLGIEINYYHLDRQRFREALVESIYHADFPLYNLNAVPVYYVSRLAREQGVKVLLAGEGGDELFGGYAWRHERLYRNVLRRRRYGKWIARLLNRGADLAYLTRDDLFLHHFRTTTNDVAGALKFASGFFARGTRFRESLEAYAFLPKDEERYAQAAMLSDVREYLEHLLNREDKSTMQTSVECRVPLLDLRVVDFALNLPYRFKVRNGEGKWIIKKVAERYLPREIIYRPKVGFNLPARQYLNFSDAIFRDGFWANTFGLQPETIAAETTNGDGSFWYSFLVTEIWGRLFIDHQSPEEINKFLG
ncbi:MAG: asparagine synthase (glutamine-hydrolyzing) [Acidobacteriota bacterium]